MASILARTFPHHGAAAASTRRLCLQAAESFQLVVVGGGAGGAGIANKFATRLGAKNVAVIEPSEDHYYQPLWTLVGAGLKTAASAHRPMSAVLGSQANWVKDRTVEFDPVRCTVTTLGGRVLRYDYLVVALGLQTNYHQIPGLVEALQHDPAVCSNYSPVYVHKTYPALQACRQGNALFTFPNTPIKCAGAPQKIMYLAEDYLRNVAGVRGDVDVIYNTSLPRIFGIPRYADVLDKIIEERDITLNTRMHLVEVRHSDREAVFEKLDPPEGSQPETVTYKYSMLHAAPPCSAPDVLRASPLADASGFAAVDHNTLQHMQFKNVFAIGDCASLPTAKTAAAVAAQIGVLSRTLTNVMNGKESQEKYDGYTSCPLVTRPGHCILAEFGYDGAILETFPVDQAKERRSMYQMKAHVMPLLYWHALLRGYWHGPGILRKLFRFGMTT